MKYNRQARLRIRFLEENRLDYKEEIIIENLRIAFSVYKTQAYTTNTANVRIWNLSQSNRNRFKNAGDEIRLFAGYEFDGGTELLFVGDVTQFSHIFEQPNIITVLEAGDGERKLNQLNISVSFDGRVSVRTVIESVAQKMGLNIVDFAQTENFYYEYGFKGIDQASVILEKVCSRLGLHASVQNDNLVILRGLQGSSKPPFEINENTGMIGVPQRYIDKNMYIFANIPKETLSNTISIICLVSSNPSFLTPCVKSNTSC